MILGLVEHRGGALEEASLQMLAAGADLADRLGVRLGAVIMGEAAPSLAEAARAHGASEVVAVRHPGPEGYAPEAWAKALGQLVEQKSASVLLAPGTDRGNEVLAHLGAAKDLPAAANCSEFHPGDPFTVTRLRWGSSLLEDAVLEGEPKLMSVAPYAWAPGEPAPAPGGEAAPEEFVPDLEEKDFRVRVARREEAVVEGVILKTAPVVIGGGRGVGGEDGYRVLEELAEILGGAVGGSRVATNNGWRPHSDQIGLTGNRIAPQLYIACGISGAIQHLVGCKGAKNILVINNDPEAPFFSKADYGVVGDLHQVVPAVIQEIKKDRS